MSKASSCVRWVVWSVVILLVAAAAAGWFIINQSAQAGKPITSTSLPVIGRISEFQLTNQNNEPITLASLRGKVWVADVIFSRCPGPCRTMTGRMAELQAYLPPALPVRLVTLTSDPEYDTPAVLKKYSDDFKANGRHWWFLTGKKVDIRGLEVNDLKFVVNEKPAADRSVPDDLFVHSTFFALVDQQGRTRGWLDKDGKLHAIYESDDTNALKQLRLSINALLQEPPQ